MAQPYEGLGRILVIIPTFNEIENVDMITSRVRQAVPQAHVLIADDNSPDGTGERADELAAADDHIHVVHRQGKEGLGKAYLDAFRWGLDEGYDALVEHDADGSHQPEELPKLLNALLGADMVKGSRWVKGGSVVNWPKSREFISRGGSLWTRMWLGIPVKDPTGGLNLFKAYVLRDIIDDISTYGYGFQVDLTWQALQHGYTVIEVPIEFMERERGVSKMSSDIFVEAALQTARWGIKHRGEQLAELGGVLTEKAGKVGERAGRFVGAFAKAAQDAVRTHRDKGDAS